MGLIIKDKLPMFKIGYPTVSDKYNVSGAILEGATAVKFGQLVQFGDTTGYFKAITGQITLDKIAGFVLATNVKVAEGFPGTNVQVNPGEAFNLTLPNTYMAVELDAGATEAQVKANATVEVILTSGKLTTVDKHDGADIVALPGVVFTGMVENHGTALQPKLVAEIYIK